MTDGRERRPPADREGRRRLSRRSVLALSSGISAALAGCSALEPDPGPPPTTSPPDDDPVEPPTETPTPDLESEFETVVDAVDDLGCDPSGESPCDAAIVEGVGEDLAIRFPSGTYRFESGHRFDEFDRLGFVGTGDVSFVPPQGFNDKLLSLVGGEVVFRGIDVDLSADATTAGLRFITQSGFAVEDVEFLGRGTHPDEAVVNALALAVQDGSARGVLRNVVARHGSAIGHYKGGNGRVGIWIGGRHHGRIRVEDCHLEEFGNNGIYGSRNNGTVEVIGGLYRNNNVSGVRLSGGGSRVSGTTIEVDLGKYTGPNTRTDSSYDTRAIVVEQGSNDRTGRVLIEDCDVRMLNADRSQGAIVVWPDGNGPRIERCRITCDVDWVAGIVGVPPLPTVAEQEGSIDIVDTTITGGGSWGSAVELIGRPESTIERSTIEQSGQQRDGLRLLESNPSTLVSTSITTTRYPIFVFNPMSSGRCLVYLSGDTRLDRTGRPLGSLQSTEIDVDGAPTDDSSEADHRCIGEALLSEIGSAEGAGIAGVEEQTLSWQHHTSIETPGDR